MKFIVEHMDPELFEWCFIEYKHIAQMLGKENALFTNLTDEQKEKLDPFAQVESKQAKDLDLSKACILDPYSDTLLTPEDNGKFDTFIFGGILGNNPAQRRTEKLTKTIPVPTRNLGPHQLSTDTAAYVTKKILDGTPYNDIHFVDEVEIEVDEGESYQLPFHYVVEGNKPIINPELIEYIKETGGFE